MHSGYSCAHLVTHSYNLNNVQTLPRGSWKENSEGEQGMRSKADASMFLDYFVNPSFKNMYILYVYFFHYKCPGCSGWVGRGVLIQLWDIIHLLGCTPRNVIIELWLDGDWGSFMKWVGDTAGRCKNTTRSIAKYQEKMPASNLFAFLGNLKLVRKEQNSAKFVTSDHCILLCGSAVHFGSYFRV